LRRCRSQVLETAVSIPDPQLAFIPRRQRHRQRHPPIGEEAGVGDAGAGKGWSELLYCGRPEPQRRLDVGGPMGDGTHVGRGCHDMRSLERQVTLARRDGEVQRRATARLPVQQHAGAGRHTGQAQRGRQRYGQSHGPTMQQCGRRSRGRDDEQGDDQDAQPAASALTRPGLRGGKGDGVWSHRVDPPLALGPRCSRRQHHRRASATWALHSRYMAEQRQLTPK